MTMITGVPCLLVVATVECRLARGGGRACGPPSVLPEPASRGSFGSGPVCGGSSEVLQP